MRNVGARRTGRRLRFSDLQRRQQRGHGERDGGETEPHDPPTAGAAQSEQQRRDDAGDENAHGRADIEQRKVKRLAVRLRLRDVGGERAAGNEGECRGNARRQPRDAEDDEIA